MDERQSGSSFGFAIWYQFSRRSIRSRSQQLSKAVEKQLARNSRLQDGCERQVSFSGPPFPFRSGVCAKDALQPAAVGCLYPKFS